MDTHFYKVSEGESLIQKTFPHNKNSETVKITHLDGTTVDSCFIGGGAEDCVDIVKSQNIVISDCDLSSSPKNPVRTHLTIKGGSSVQVHYVDFDNNSKWPWQISVGDYTIYDDPIGPKTNVEITGAAYYKDGKCKKPTVLVLNGEVEHDGSVKVWKIPSFIVKIFFWFKSRL